MTDEATLRGGNSSAGGLDHYQHADWLGNARLGSQPYAAPPWSETAYAPFGEPYAQSGATDLSFTGQNSDTVSGDYDFLFREYSIQGRWPSPDPAGLAAVDLADPQSLDRYAYVGGNPLGLVDPLGFGPEGPPVQVCFVNGTMFTGATCDLIYDTFCRNWVYSSFQGTGGTVCSRRCPLGDCVKEPKDRDRDRGNNSSRANNAQGPKSVKDQCLAEYYDSKLGKTLDFGSLLGLVPGWSPNASQNLKTIAELGALKGGGLTVALKALGRVAAVASFYGTGLDILAHAGCDAVARQQTGQMTPTPVTFGA